MSKTTVKLSKKHSIMLGKISRLVGETKEQVLESYIEAFIKSFVELFELEGASILDKKIVYMPTVKLSTLVSGSISMSLEVSEDEADKILSKELEKKGIK